MRQSTLLRLAVAGAAVLLPIGLVASPAIAADPTSSISGAVVDLSAGPSNPKPLAGMDVIALSASTAGLTPVTATKTDATGAYKLDKLPAGKYVVAAIDPNGNFSRTAYDADRTDTTPYTLIDVDGVAPVATPIVLPTLPRGGVAGTITDPSGQPAAGVLVRLTDGSGWKEIQRTETDAQGNYSFSKVETSGLDVSYKLDVYDQSGKYLRQWYDAVADAKDGTNVTVTPATVTTINQKLSLAGHISGLVFKADGTWQEGAGIRVYHKNDKGEFVLLLGAGTLTKADGSYDIGGLPTGEYKLDFIDPKYAALPEWYFNARSLETSQVINVVAGQTTPWINATWNYKPIANVTRPVISGQPKVGRTVKVSTGTWNFDQLTYKYQWFAGRQKLVGKTGSSLKVTKALKGRRLNVKVTASRKGFFSGQVKSRWTTRVVG